MNGLGQVALPYRLATFQIRDGATHLENAILGAGGKAQGFYGGSKQRRFHFRIDFET
jgi:hypothetical protein